MILDWLPQYQDRINDAIKQCFDLRYSAKNAVEMQFEEAMRYAVEGGGKRFRTILAGITFEHASGKDMNEILHALIGIEMIHAYTLVHDDLPCMDNDELRRGKPTVWKHYGETMAVLVADALQSLGIELLASTGEIFVIQEITSVIGDRGLVRGQVRDTLLRHNTLALDELLRIHDEKTGCFIAASLVIGGYLGGLRDEKIIRLRSLGLLLGRAFQIRDDILDIEGDTTIVGKELQKDGNAGKGIVACVGLEASKNLLREYEETMYELAQDFSYEKLDDCIHYVVTRDR